jgi:hypothetical protein
MYRRHPRLARVGAGVALPPVVRPPRRELPPPVADPVPARRPPRDDVPPAVPEPARPCRRNGFLEAPPPARAPEAAPPRLDPARGPVPPVPVAPERAAARRAERAAVPRREAGRGPVPPVPPVPPGRRAAPPAPRAGEPGRPALALARESPGRPAPGLARPPAPGGLMRPPPRPRAPPRPRPPAARPPPGIRIRGAPPRPRGIPPPLAIRGIPGIRGILGALPPPLIRGMRGIPGGSPPDLRPRMNRTAKNRTTITATTMSRIFTLRPPIPWVRPAIPAASAQRPIKALLAREDLDRPGGPPGSGGMLGIDTANASWGESGGVGDHRRGGGPAPLVPCPGRRG